MKIQWSRAKDLGGYDISSTGDVRYSSYTAKMPDGRSLEAWYQCDVKGYEPGGTQITLGKGNVPLVPYKGNELFIAYKGLWRIWAVYNIPLMKELLKLAQSNGNLLIDYTSTSDVCNARALSEILNEWLLQIEE